jgi:transmembrane sensor
MSTEDERRARAAEDAATWLIHMESSAMSDKERAKFADWIRESPMHVAEMLRAGLIHQALTNFARRGLIEPIDKASVPNVTELTPPKNHRLSGAGFRSPGRWVALTASLVCIAVIAGLLLSRSAPISVSTQAGERRELSLPDGSAITIAPNSRLLIAFSSSDRLILLERGQVLFRVAKDPKRPFVVDTGGARTRDIGTTFSVERGQDGTVVTVIEGRVDVRPENARNHFDVQGGGRAPSVSLGRDEQVTISGAGMAAPVRKVSSRNEASWAQGQLVFDNSKVSDIVQRFNQYNSIQIRVTDPSLATRLITGVFSEDDPRSFAEFLQSEAGAAVHLSSNGEIVIGASNSKILDSSAPQTTH